MKVSINIQKYVFNLDMILEYYQAHFSQRVYTLHHQIHVKSD